MGGATPSVPSKNKGNTVVSSEVSKATGSVNSAASTGTSSIPSTVSASGAGKLGKLASSSTLVAVVGAAVSFFC